MSRQSISCRSIGISAQLLHWSPAVNAVQVAAVTENGTRPFDVIIASDCLFFREFHCDLVQTLRLLLSRDGVCLFLQPRRTHTMQSFVDKCDPYFHTEIMEDYSVKVGVESAIMFISKQAYLITIHYFSRFPSCDETICLLLRV